ncbi:hypothetical protein K458DRAFT_420576 [Lentithecium fluviatile CBS 122367]|uniref:Uncharacterized protein n=1 Tax=Lentithecium fluviatile CBS 122367 TaxID=1168545 RepID=A0A6G1ITY2_9PLEO|nr:hypothetical protein K458DRAFT_420576 [Lentithecium fluviatile CBS 122367]
MLVVKTARKETCKGIISSINHAPRTLEIPPYMPSPFPIPVLFIRMQTPRNAAPPCPCPSPHPITHYAGNQSQIHGG